MDKIISKDGTPIAYQRSGAGSPLVLVHGTSSFSNRWEAVLPAFEQLFTVYAMERRGRGESGDSAEYSIEREADDVTALVDSIPEPVMLLGHSYGGICALEASLRTKNIKKMVLYEPAVGAEGVQAHGDDVIEKMQSLLAKGDREGILETFTREVLRMPGADFQRWRSSPAWQARLAVAHTIPREIEARAHYRFDPKRFANMTVPTLLLMGDQSPAFLQAGTRVVHQALPNSELVVMQGQGHVAMDSAPGLFTHEVLAFLTK